MNNEITSKDMSLKLFGICGALHDLVPFLQFKKREKHPWRSVNFCKVAGLKLATLLKLTLLHGCLPRFLNCTNGTKSCNVPHILSFYMSNEITGTFNSVIGRTER